MKSITLLLGEIVNFILVVKLIIILIFYKIKNHCIIFQWINCSHKKIYLYYQVNCVVWTTMHFWRDNHSTSINACEVWRAIVGIQVSKREFHTHIHLDWTKVEFLFCILKKKIVLCADPLKSFSFFLFTPNSISHCSWKQSHYCWKPSYILRFL